MCVLYIYIRNASNYRNHLLHAKLLYIHSRPRLGRRVYTVASLRLFLGYVVVPAHIRRYFPSIPSGLFSFFNSNFSRACAQVNAGIEIEIERGGRDLFERKNRGRQSGSSIYRGHYRAHKGRSLNEAVYSTAVRQVLSRRHLLLCSPFAREREAPKHKRAARRRDDIRPKFIGLCIKGRRRRMSLLRSREDAEIATRCASEFDAEGRAAKLE